VTASTPSLTGILSRMAECQARLSATDPAGLAPADVTLLSEHLADVEKDLREWARPPRQRSTPTPPTLRTLLLLARADLAVELSGEPTPTEQLARVVCLAVRLVPGTEHAGVSLQRGGQKVENLAATSTIATACDQARHDLGEGPLPQVGVIHGSIRIDDLGAERRWPRFAARAVELGVRSMLVCELPGTRGGTGMLSLYSSRRRGFNAASELVAPVFASRAALALAHAEQVLNLRRAIGTRQVIGEAVGILMERHRLTADQAFERLVTVSQHRHVKLRELATRLTETGEEPDTFAV
jgi:hypothetical protein